MRKKQITSLILVAAVAVSTMAVPVNAAKIKVKSVTVQSTVTGDKKNVIIAKGKKVKLATKVSTNSQKTAATKVSFKSKNKKIATVSNKGVVKGKKAGSTKITVASKINKKKKVSINVKVMKGVVKKVKLNCNSVSLKRGATYNLKASVNATAGAYQKVKFESSNNKVATVDSNGKVTAINAGKATVVVKALDGSNQSARTNIIVSNSVANNGSNPGSKPVTKPVSNPTVNSQTKGVNLKNISVCNDQTIIFSLDKAYELKNEQIDVRTKTYKSGKYNKKLCVSHVSTSNRITYTVVVNNEDVLSEGEWVQISIPSLSGSVKSIEMEYKDGASTYELDEKIYGIQDDDLNESIYFDKAIGYSSWNVSDLPEGLKYKDYSNRIIVYGRPTKAGNYTSSVVATDEYGNVMKKSIQFIIGSDTIIAATASPVYELIGSAPIEIATSVDAMGGSGKYKCSVIDDSQMTNAQAYCDEDNENGYVSSKISKAGNYVVCVRVSDALNDKIYKDVKVTYHISQGVTIGGCIKDAQGLVMSSGTVTFINKNKSSNYCESKSAYMNNLSYSILVEPGEYDIKAEFDGSDSGNDKESSYSVKYLYSQKITENKTGYDIQLPDLYRVTLNTKFKDQSVDFKTWYNNGDEIGSTDSDGTIYLRPGTYQLTSNEFNGVSNGDWFNGKTVTDYKFITDSFKVIDCGVQIVANEKATTTVHKYSAAKNTPYSIELDENRSLFETTTTDFENYYYNAFSFTPSETGLYNNVESGIMFFDMTGKEIVINDDGYFYLNANTKYIVGINDYEECGNCVQISKKTVDENENVDE